MTNPILQIPKNTDDINLADLELVSLKQLSVILGRHPKTIWVWWAKEQAFPKPIMFNGRCMGWRKKALLDWITNLEAKS